MTAALYNGAHKNQQLNDVPNEAGAHSDTLAQFRTTQDPAPGGTANLVAALADELEQIRFKIADIKTVLQAGVPPAQWYTPVTVSNTIQAGKGARVYKTANQSINSNTQTACTFDTVRFDTGVNGSGADLFWAAGTPTRLTAPNTGLYEINGFLRWPAATVGPVAAYIRLNGTKILTAMEWTADGTEDIWIPVATQYVLNANEYVELIAYQNSGGAVITLRPEFGIELLNPSVVVPPFPLFGVLFGFGPTSGIGTTGTFFFSPATAMSDIVATDAAVHAVIPNAITLKTLTITLSAAIAAGSTVTFKYVVNGVASSAITLLMTDASGRSGTAAGTLPLAANDTLSIQVVTNATIPVAAIQSFTGKYIP